MQSPAFPPILRFGRAAESPNRLDGTGDWPVSCRQAKQGLPPLHKREQHAEIFASRYDERYFDGVEQKRVRKNPNPDSRRYGQGVAAGTASIRGRRVIHREPDRELLEILDIIESEKLAKRQTGVERRAKPVGESGIVSPTPPRTTQRFGSPCQNWICGPSEVWPLSAAN